MWWQFIAPKWCILCAEVGEMWVGQITVLLWSQGNDSRWLILCQFLLWLLLKASCTFGSHLFKQNVLFWCSECNNWHQTFFPMWGTVKECSDLNRFGPKSLPKKDGTRISKRWSDIYTGTYCTLFLLACGDEVLRRLLSILWLRIFHFNRSFWMLIIEAQLKFLVNGGKQFHIIFEVVIFQT